MWRRWRRDQSWPAAVCIQTECETLHAAQTAARWGSPPLIPRECLEREATGNVSKHTSTISTVPCITLCSTGAPQGTVLSPFVPTSHEPPTNTMPRTIWSANQTKWSNKEGRLCLWEEVSEQSCKILTALFTTYCTGSRASSLTEWFSSTGRRTDTGHLS